MPTDHTPNWDTFMGDFPSGLADALPPWNFRTLDLPIWQ